MAQDATGKALQIISLNLKKEGSQPNQVVLNEDNFKQLCNNLEATKADAVSIVAIWGKYRTGKSFALDLLMRYLRFWEFSSADETKDKAAEYVGRKMGEARNKAYEYAKEQGKSEEEAKGAGDRAAREVEESMQFPPKRRSGWTIDCDKKFPPPEWVHCTAAAVASGKLQQEERETLGHGSFKWKGGDVTCTQGMWVWSRPFILPYNGRKIAVLLMDTQGAYDNIMTPGHAATLFGLTMKLASKCICNVPQRLGSHEIAQIEYLAKRSNYVTTDGTTQSEQKPPFGHLEFLIRDYVYDDGLGYDQCKEKMSEHLTRFLTKEGADGIERNFRELSCFGLPEPGKRVKKPDFHEDSNCKFEYIESDFFVMLDEFARSFFHHESFPIPSEPMGKEVTPKEFEDSVRSLVDAFSRVTTIAKNPEMVWMNCEYSEQSRAFKKQFLEKLGEIAPDSRVLDHNKLQQQGEDLIKETTRDLAERVRALNLDDHNDRIEAFRRELCDAVVERAQANQRELDSAENKLWMTPAVCVGLYFTSPFGFLTGHPVIDACLLCMGAFYMVKNAKRGLEAELGQQDSAGAKVSNWEVLKRVKENVWSFSKHRIRDGRAMLIVAQDCTPQKAKDQAMAKLTGALGMGKATVATNAAAVDATATNAAQEHGSNGNGVNGHVAA